MMQIESQIMNYYHYQKSRRWLRRIFSWRKILKLALVSLVSLVILAALLFAWYSKDLPTPGKIKKMKTAASTRILDRNGNLLYDVHGTERRLLVDFKDIPGFVKEATVAVEDKDFYRHRGIKFTSILRAIGADILHRGAVQGGSTITQQFVKNALLSPQKSLSRKIKELILSLEIEGMYSKDQILGMYLNEIPYGTNAYGIEAAAKTYFDKSAKDLTISEAAFLVALPKAPTYYSPYGQHKDALLARKDFVLDRMTEVGFLDKGEAEEAKKDPVIDRLMPRRENIIAPHFVMFVREKLIDAYGEQMVNEGGLTVYTTLDIEKQKKAEEAIEKNVKMINGHGASNAALTAIDPKTGEILAMVGSVDYFDTKNDGNVNVAISDRQPGSSFKPIAYAAAFKGKYNPASPLFDITTDFGNYQPQDYDGKNRGLVTIREALANSLNIPAVKILYLAGLDKVVDTAHELGITTLNDRERYGLSLVLGGGEVKPLDMATAFGVFANQGILQETHAILKVNDGKGKVLSEYKNEDHRKEVLDPQITYLISDILSDNNARSMIFGPNSPLNFGARRVAAKTGTTQEFHDGWTVGYTPSISTAIWVGNNDNKAMTSRSDGVVVAAPIFRAFMNEMLKTFPQEDFIRPSGIQEIVVSKISNKLPTDMTPEEDKIKDIFASWQVPTEEDDVHIKIKVCKATGEQADDSIPSELTEERVVSNIHSEVPDKPNWEEPVLEWARNAGYQNFLPQQKCSLDAEKNRPIISIITPKSGEVMNGLFKIAAEINAPFGVKKVEFSIDGIVVNTDADAPYEVDYDSSSLSSGKHTISIRVTDNVSLINSASVNIEIDKNLPQNIKNVSLSPGNGTVLLSWQNPDQDNLVAAFIYVSENSGNLGKIDPNQIPVSRNSKSAYAVTNLENNRPYYFTIRIYDRFGRENRSQIQYSAVPKP